MRRLFAVALITFTSHVSLAMAQDAGRIDQLEEQVRLLTGQVEELTYTVKQLQGQLKPGMKMGENTAAPAAPTVVAKARATVAAQDSSKSSDGIEVIDEQPLGATQQAVVADDTSGEPQQQVSIYGDEGSAAPAPTTLANSRRAAAQPNDGGFQGKLIVPQDSSDGSTPVTDGGIEQVSLTADTPEALYKRSDEALLRRQFGDAEQGFKTFLTSYPDHSLAGSAQYWLGETYYAQGDYRTAAQSFLQGYQKYPKSRRAPDSLLKLGVALAKLGQKDQACSFLGSVGSEYPKAVEANKRAQAEFRRAGC